MVHRYNSGMRSVVLCLGISVDGYIARPDGAVDFLFLPKDFSMAPFLATIDTIVMGRKTLDASLKMGDSSFDPTKATYVFSRTQPPGARDGVLFTSDYPASVIPKIRKKAGKDIWLMGGGELIHDFLKADLVDELFLGIVPTLLGAGIPLFPAGFPQRDFEFVEANTFSQGMVTLKYRRARSKARSKKNG